MKSNNLDENATAEEAFEKLKDEENFIIIDGNRSQEEIAEDIWNEVRKYFV